MKSFKLTSGFIFKLLQDNLIIQDTNIIVNAANEDLWLGGGVAGAIRTAGGPDIQRECKEIVKEKGSIATGQVVSTGIGNFKIPNLKYIFHAVGPIYRDGTQNEPEELYNAFMNCLKLAEELKMESLSLPPISSGIFGFPKDQCAEIFFKALTDYLESKELDGLKEVRMVILDDITFNVFDRIYDEQIEGIRNKLGDRIEDEEGVKF
jgi:O-acetyl-ADP-ribose deacetylase (regulator of RNase III)